jgi:hypothetical protein
MGEPVVSICFCNARCKRAFCYGLAGWINWRMGSADARCFLIRCPATLPAQGISRRRPSARLVCRLAPCAEVRAQFTVVLNIPSNPNDGTHGPDPGRLAILIGERRARAMVSSATARRLVRRSATSTRINQYPVAMLLGPVLSLVRERCPSLLRTMAPALGDRPNSCPSHFDARCTCRAVRGWPVVAG